MANFNSGVDSVTFWIYLEELTLTPKRRPLATKQTCGPGEDVVKLVESKIS